MKKKAKAVPPPAQPPKPPVGQFRTEGKLMPIGAMPRLAAFLAQMSHKKELGDVTSISSRLDEETGKWKVVGKAEPEKVEGSCYVGPEQPELMLEQAELGEYDRLKVAFREAMNKKCRPLTDAETDALAAEHGRNLNAPLILVAYDEACGRQVQSDTCAAAPSGGSQQGSEEIIQALTDAFFGKYASALADVTEKELKAFAQQVRPGATDHHRQVAFRKAMDIVEGKNPDPRLEKRDRLITAIVDLMLEKNRCITGDELDLLLPDIWPDATYAERDDAHERASQTHYTLMRHRLSSGFSEKMLAKDDASDLTLTELQKEEIVSEIFPEADEAMVDAAYAEAKCHAAATMGVSQRKRGKAKKAVSPPTRNEYIAKLERAFSDKMALAGVTKLSAKQQREIVEVCEDPATPFDAYEIKEAYKRARAHIGAKS